MNIKTVNLVKIAFVSFTLLLSYIPLSLAATSDATPATGSVYYSDVESGQGGWTSDGLWHITTNRYNSPTHSFWYGDENTKTYNTGGANSGSLTSPQITLASNSQPVLYFWSWYQTENSQAYDKKVVQISVNGGQWTDLKLITDAKKTWNKETIDLSSYAGNTIRLRFLFDTVDENLNNYEGWYVDDIQITSDAISTATLTSTPTPTKTSTRYTTATLTAVNDTSIKSGMPNLVRDSIIWIDLGRLTGSENGNYHGLLYFDLSTIPSNAVINNANLTLTWYYNNRNQTTVIDVFKPSSAWDPLYATWNSRLNGVAWTTPGGDWTDKNGVSYGNTPYGELTYPVDSKDNADIDVTTLVQEYVSGKYPNNGFFLKANEIPDSYVAFYSSNWNNDSQRPKLVINYTSTTPTATPAPTPSPTPTPTPIPNDAAYIISITGNTINAKNTSTGQIEFTGTDISDVLTSVNDAITDGGTILIQGGIYTPSSPVTFTKSIKIIANGNAVFNWNVQDNYLFAFNGLELSTTTITGNVAKGANTIAVKSVGSAQPGDLVLIYDSSIWNPVDFPTWKTGELHKVLSINGNTITITDSTVNAFTTARSGSVRLIRPTTVEINGITVTGADGTAGYEGIQLKYTKNSAIVNGRYQNNGDTNIGILNSYNTTVNNNVIGNDTNAGTGYGVSVADASAYTNITNNSFSNCRHCVSVGGYGVVGQSRETNVSSNIFTDTTGTFQVIDAHAIAESYYIYNNTIYSPPGQNALSSGAKITKFIGNTVIGGDGTAIRDNTIGSDFNVSGNTFINSKHVFQGGLTGTISQINIRNNNVTGSSISSLTRIWNAPSFVITGNNFNSTDTGSGYAVLDIQNSSNGIISDNIIYNAYYSGIQLVSSDYTTVSNNTISYYDNGGSDSDSGVRLSDSSHNNIANNILVKHPDAHTYGVVETGNSDYNSIYDNDLTGVGTSAVTAQRVEVIGRNTLVKNNQGYP